MRKLTLILFLMIGITVSGCTGNSTSEAKDDKTVKTSAAKSGEAGKAEWVSFDKGMERAGKEKKHMIVDFYTDWCHWCKVMDEKTFSNEEVNAELAANFVTVRIDAEDKNATATYKGKTYNNVELTQAFGVRGFPSLGFLNSDGEVITLVPGYVPPETFIYILKYIDQECYTKQMSFEDFMKKKGECEEDKSKS